MWWLVVVAGLAAASVPRPYPAAVLLPEVVRRVARAGGLRAVCAPGAPRVSLGRPRWRRFVLALCSAFAVRGNATDVRVSVVGGGPVGLLSALAAHAAGARVTVLEKRRVYGRQMWFDLSDGAWGRTLRLLESWGLAELAPELGLEEGPLQKLSYDEERVVSRIATLQCHRVERFLATIAALLGVDIRYGVEWQPTEEAEAEVLIGADGARSAVRAVLGIAEQVVPGVAQDSLLVAFAECPSSDGGSQLHSWEFSLHDSRVSMVYFRFLPGHCELQILLRAAATADGALAERNEQLELVRTIVSLGMPEAFPTEEALQRAVSSVQLLRTRVSRALDTTVCRDAAACSRVGILVGDAVFPAHYRLGIGINSAVDSMRNLGVFLQRPRSQWREEVERKKVVDDDTIARVWRHQLHTVWLESACGAHVFQEWPHPGAAAEDRFGYAPPADLGPLHVVRVHSGSLLSRRPRGRERVRAQPFSVVLTMDEALSACRERVQQPPWEEDWDPAEDAVRRAMQAPEGDVPGMLEQINSFAKHEEWLMTVGPVKGLLLQDAARRARPRAAVLELGTYIGFGTLLLSQAVANDTRILTVEPSERRALLARRLLRHAGRLGQVQVLEGKLENVLETVQREAGTTGLGLVFLDHKKDRYLPDLLLLEAAGSLLRRGTVIVADNVLTPGAPDFRAHLQEHAERYDTVEHRTLLEYTEDTEDIVTVSLVK